jgi:hypothetical protein
MGYYVRAFCSAADVPPLGAVLDWVSRQGVAVRVAPEAGDIDLASPTWEDVPLLYAAGQRPILCSVSRDDGSPQGLFREEVREFEEFLEDAEDTPARERVLRHLGQSRYVVANQLMGDVNDAGYTASALVLEYFVDHGGGLVQADGEGFYDGETLIVSLA